jgi:hypothetical protein
MCIPFLFPPNAAAAAAAAASTFIPVCRYSIIVLVVECIGISAVLPYGLLNVCHTHPTGSQGLPADDGTLLPDKT